MQPWGKPLPAQCPKCLSFRSWGDRKNRHVAPSGLDPGEAFAEFRCQGKIKKADCNYLFVVKQPKNLTGTIGDWLVVTWPPEKEEDHI